MYNNNSFKFDDLAEIGTFLFLSKNVKAVKAIKQAKSETKGAVKVR
jgi:3-keto-L-gulonate-6-phosphate decarboxylase